VATEFIKDHNRRGSIFEEDFEEICTLGKGHFGSVVRCRNKIDWMEYAIKITNKSNSKHSTSVAQAIQEVYTLSNLSV
jgi:serine/threonine protein kinase